MNAPETIAPPATISMEIPLDQLRASKTNPRKHFDKDALAELASSVKSHGVMQPILVRPHGDEGYEIVAGERRYRAAKIAGLASVPAIVRELTDVQTLEMQVIENLQRSDLHPLEEAEGYEQLMKLHRQTADELAAKVGKSRGYVYARLKLLSLSPAARKAFYAGDLVPSVATFIARIPSQLQDKALKEVTEKDRLGEPLSVRAAAEHIQRNFMLRLSEAPFKTSDAKLLPKAGECGTCPKRTGNQPELFQDVSRTDVCTDPTCFAAKREAHYAVIRRAAEASGKEVITGKAAKEIAKYGSDHLQGGFVRADATHHWMGSQTIDVKAALKKVADVPVKLLEVPSTHELVPVVEQSALAAAMKKAGLITTTPKSKTSNTTKRAKTPSGPDPHEIEQQIRRRVIDAIRGRITADASTVSTADGTLVATALWNALMACGGDLIDHLPIVYGWVDPPKEGKLIDHSALKDIPNRFASLSVAELWRAMIDFSLATMVEEVSYSKNATEPPELYAAASRHGVDAAAIRAEVLAAEKAKLEEAKTAAKEKTAKAKKKAAAK